MGMMWLWVIIAVALTAGAVWLVARSVGGRTALSSPEELLKRRYALGEIEREEYERRLADLRE